VKDRPALPAIDPVQRYSVSEVIWYLRSSRKTVFNDIKTGRLPSFKDGKRRFVSGAALIERSRAPSASPEAA
jgi:hypothetical protein